MTETTEDDERPIGLDPLEVVRRALAVKDEALLREFEGLRCGAVALALLAAALDAARRGFDPVTARRAVLAGVVANLEAAIRHDRAGGNGAWQRVRDAKVIFARAWTSSEVVR